MLHRAFRYPLLLLAALPAAGQLPLEAHRLTLQNGKSITLRVPADYGIAVAAEGLHRLRFLAKSPDGRLFATDLHNLDDNKQGRIYLLEGWDETTKRFNTVSVFADGLHNPNQLLFYTGPGGAYLYVAETDKLTRYRYEPGSRTLPATGQVLARFPDYGLSYKYGGWHLTRSLAQHGGKVYVSVGSSCNACLERESIRATIVEMNPDGTGQHIYAQGVRNAVGLRWVGDRLWATLMGRDGLGPDQPEELLSPIAGGRHYGWPFYYQYRKRIHPDKAMQDSARRLGKPVPAPPPVAPHAFPAHAAPLGFDYLAGFSDTRLADRFLVALHGSTSVWRKRGNAVVAVDAHGTIFPVVDGFLTGTGERDRQGRPCDVLQNDDRSFFVTDDKAGVLYYIWR